MLVTAAAALPHAFAADRCAELDLRRAGGLLFDVTGNFQDMKPFCVAHSMTLLADLWRRKQDRASSQNADGQLKRSSPSIAAYEYLARQDPQNDPESKKFEGINVDAFWEDLRSHPTCEHQALFGAPRSGRAPSVKLPPGDPLQLVDLEMDPSYTVRGINLRGEESKVIAALRAGRAEFRTTKFDAGSNQLFLAGVLAQLKSEQAGGKAQGKAGSLKKLHQEATWNREMQPVLERIACRIEQSVETDELNRWNQDHQSVLAKLLLSVELMGAPDTTLVAAYFEQACSKQRITAEPPLPELVKLEPADESPASREALAQRIETSLDSISSMPVQVSYCAEFLRSTTHPSRTKGLRGAHPPCNDSKGQAGEHSHSSLLIGKRRSAAGRCQYLLRNSWGVDCRLAKASGMDCTPGQGDTWVDAEEFIDNTLSVRTVPR